MKKTGVLFLLITCLMLAACGNVEKTVSEKQEAKETQKSDNQDAAQEVKEKQEQGSKINSQEENNEESGRNVPAQKEENLPEKQNIVLQNLQINCNEDEKKFTLRAGDKIDKILIESITNDEVLVKSDNGNKKSLPLGNGASVRINAGSYNITLTDIQDGHVTAYVLDTKCFQ
ncbi:hypothetical protein [Bacillus paramycoides]|uniref:hypothetical protein n=1 Tax=Bacillus paramycoides TaxID=2026194 RepID=UPI003D07D88C